LLRLAGGLFGRIPTCCCCGIGCSVSVILPLTILLASFSIFGSLDEVELEPSVSVGLLWVSLDFEFEDELEDGVLDGEELVVELEDDELDDELDDDELDEDELDDELDDELEESEATIWIKLFI